MSHPSLRSPHLTASQTSFTTALGFHAGSLAPLYTPLLTSIDSHWEPHGLRYSFAPLMSLSGLSPTMYTRRSLGSSFSAPEGGSWSFSADSASRCWRSCVSAKWNVSRDGFPMIFFCSVTPALLPPVIASHTPSTAARNPPWPSRGMWYAAAQRRCGLEK